MHFLRLRQFLIFLLASLLLAACGGESVPVTPAGNDQSTTAPAPSSTQATSAQVASTAKATQNSASPTPPSSNQTAPSVSGQVPSITATGHPRLWLTAQDLPRLRAWAVESNPLYRDGLLAVAQRAKAEMDSGKIPQADTGDRTYEEYPSEMYAELFAFMSLVSNNPSEREDYAKRAKTLLMHVINQAAAGVAEAKPFRDPEFATNDRSRWHGEAFGLTVDWIYPYLSSADKEAIRKVFLRWSEEISQAAITGHDHPQSTGKLNDPALVKDNLEVRWSGNNYWTAHMRNLGLMALAFDPTDDPNNKLRDYLGKATGEWLFVFDHFLRNEAKGGILPEGFEYSPQTAAYALQFLLALQTAGQADPAKWGQQVALANNPFWNDFVAGYLHSLSPVATTHPDLGQVYQPAWFGDGLKYWGPDFIGAFGPLGLYGSYTGNQNLLAQMRWIQTNLAPGGSADLAKRLTGTTFYQETILYFMLFDPAASPTSDPRSKLPLSFFAPGLGRLLSRTTWDKNASWFTYKLSWNSVDHQNGDGNQFEFYRKGEWLTKERSGYDLDYGSSENHNTLAIENTPPERNDAGDYRNLNWKRGSQWAYVSTGNPQVVAKSSTADFEYVAGDATNLYNSEREGSTDVVHASRSILWLKPDYIVVYDRAETKKEGAFKRFWLNFAYLPTINGKQATVTTANGQQLAVTTLLPENAVIAAETNSQQTLAGDVAEQETMKFKLKIEAKDNPKKVRFLHVLQAADAGVKPAGVELMQSVESGSAAYAGAVIANKVVMFPVELDATATFASLNYSVPNNVTEHYVTGLKSSTGYNVTINLVDGKKQLKVTTTAPFNYQTNEGGVLVIVK